MGGSGKTICGNPKARVIFSNRKPKVSFLSVRNKAKCLLSPFLVNTARVVLTRKESQRHLCYKGKRKTLNSKDMLL